VTWENKVKSLALWSSYLEFSNHVVVMLRSDSVGGVGVVPVKFADGSHDLGSVAAQTVDADHDDGVTGRQPDSPEQPAGLWQRRKLLSLRVSAHTCIDPFACVSSDLYLRYRKLR
jgi:hypothetical protein